MVRGVSHTEFIHGDDQQFYFLETAARVGGAFITDTIEVASGINLWEEWARIETGTSDSPYQVAPSRDTYAGLILSLARQEWPDPFSVPGFRDCQANREGPSRRAYRREP
jgi:biotin carboxylase